MTAELKNYVNRKDSLAFPMKILQSFFNLNSQDPQLLEFITNSIILIYLRSYFERFHKILENFIKFDKIKTKTKTSYAS